MRIRLHYVLYASARLALIGKETSVKWGLEDSYGEALHFCLAWEEVAAAMDFVSGENGPDIVSESMFALSRESLIRNWLLASQENFEERA